MLSALIGRTERRYPVDKLYQQIRCTDGILVAADMILHNMEAQEVFKKSAVKVWECRNCGHIVIGTNAPDVCPVCARPKAYFEVNAENYRSPLKTES